MSLDLRLKDRPAPRVDSINLADHIQIVRAITASNLAKSSLGGEPSALIDRKEKMKRRLMERGKNVTFEQATDEVGRQRILLSLYLEYATRSEASWLPPFDASVADSVLAGDGREWHAGQRGKAALLFFTHFDQLPASGLSRLCDMLFESFDCMESEGLGDVAEWRVNRKLIFSPEGHQNIAASGRVNETLPSLMERFAIPSDGRFAESIRRVFLLNKIRDCPLGAEVPALTDIESLKTEQASASQLLGAAALKIMVQRVANEGGRKWSGTWSSWITRLGCDPRHGRSTAEGSRWWGWATDEELRLAQQGITGLTLRFFIEFLRKSLEGTEREPQFELRARFLLGLYESGKIDHARLALNWSAYQHLDKKYRDVWTVSHLSATTDETSMICLKCIDDIFVIEGTHSFGLRMFHKTFPIFNFWERPKGTYQDQELRISPGECPVFLRHDPGGKWVTGFFHHLATRFHVEWNDVRL